MQMGSGAFCRFSMNKTSGPQRKEYYDKEKIFPPGRFAAALFALLLTFSFVGCRDRDTSLGKAQIIPSTEKEEAASFDEFCDAAFAELVSDDTLSLHFTLRDPSAYKIAAADVSFADLSPAGMDKTRKTYEHLLNRLKTYSHHDLTERQQLVFDTLQDYLKQQTAFSSYPYYEKLLSPSSGVHLDLPILLSEFVFSSCQRRGRLSGPFKSGGCLFCSNPFL